MNLLQRTLITAFLLIAAPALPAFAADTREDRPTRVAASGRGGPAYGTPPPFCETGETLLSRLRKGLDLPEKTEWFEIDLPAIYPLALGKNIRLLQARGQEKIARAALREAEARYDPRLMLSFQYARTEVFNREEEALEWKKNTTSAPFDPDPVYVVLPEHSPVAYLKYDRERREGYYLRTVVASEQAPDVPEESTSYRLAVEQHIPWGLDLDASLKVIDQDTLWENNAKSWGFYERPWRSILIENLTIPLPGTRGFGPYHDADYRIKKADMEEEIARWEVRILENETLLEVESVYWDLVSSLRTLSALIRHGEHVDFLIRRTRALYEERMATAYDMAQVEAASARFEQREQQAVQAFLVSSNRLAELLDAGKDRLFLPVEDAFGPAGPSAPLAEEGPAANMEGNPELMRQALMIQSARLLEKHREVNARPDLALHQTLTFGQGASGFGFMNMEESIKKVFTRPDRIRQMYTLTYRYPFLNRKANAALDQSRLLTEREEVLLASLKNRLSREVRDALVGLSSTRARIDIARRNLDLAGEAFERALAYQQTREVTEYEVVIKSETLLDAELRWVRARIENRKAEALLLGALGKLEERHAGRPVSFCGSEASRP